MTTLTTCQKLSLLEHLELIPARETFSKMVQKVFNLIIIYYDPGQARKIAFVLIEEGKFLPFI